MLLPQHLAIIMDGNGRWALSRGKPRGFGHVKGTRVAKKIIENCSERSIKFLTLYAFSSENWFRPEAEVSILMKLLKKYLQKELQSLLQQNIRFFVIGDMRRLPSDVQEILTNSIEKTKHCTGMNLTFALSYGSREEILSAAISMGEALARGEISREEISERYFEKYLFTHFAPDPDLIIRTSGEQRLSNFLLWQAAYSEFYFTKTLWPDFSLKDLEQALESYSLRQRRFGQISTK